MSKHLLILAVGTDMTHGLQRFITSCKNVKLHHKILGLDKQWKGGNMAIGMGGGMKVNLLKEELQTLDDDQLILFSDSYDVIMCASEEEIIRKYKAFQTPVIFGAEKSCWPDTSLANKYPQTNSVYRFLNSGGFIGHVKDIKKMLITSIAHSDDDQLYYTNFFLANQDFLSLDYYSSIFQTLNGSLSHIEYNSEGSKRIHNIIFDTYPCQIHGNGPLGIKIYLNHLENYLLDRNSTTMDNRKPNKVIYLSVFVDSTAKSYRNLSECLRGIFSLDYPKRLIELHFFSNSEFDCQFDGKKSYRMIQVHVLRNSEQIIRDSIISQFNSSEAEYWFHVDLECQLTNKNIITELLSSDRDIIAPMIRKRSGYFTNFWGAIDDNGFYARSSDYFLIADRNLIGSWNVPYIRSCYLVSKVVAKQLINSYSNGFRKEKGSDMAFCENLRKSGIYMYVDNSIDYGVMQI